ncbi:MAG: glycosyltransferase family 2 protein [Bacteroidetes bacterium]|nr:MAG: glycosyltransferase family 2 protein [Bacteroidota bacterium]
MQALFWIGIGLISFTYLGYGLVVWLWLKLGGKHQTPPAVATADLPAVTLLIAAYNEGDILPEKLANCRALDYPKEKLHLLFVTDGSCDGSEQWLQGQAGLRVLHQRERRGKIAAVKRAMREVYTPITVFTDANTFLNPGAIRRLVADFQDPRVGAVAGEKRVISTGNAGSGGEGLYWRYESFLKKQDSQLYSVVGAAGELYAIRTKLYHEVPADTILDDFMHTLLIAKDGYRVSYAPEAIAEEHASASVAEELKRKVRICAGGFQSMRRLLPLLNIFRYGKLSFQYIGHRVLRWTLAPLFLPIVLVANVWLVAQGAHWLYTALLAGQVLFYALAGLGYLLQHCQVGMPGFFAPYYFVIMNYSVYAGFWRYVQGKQKAAWEKAKRAVVEV